VKLILAQNKLWKEMFLRGNDPNFSSFRRRSSYPKNEMKIARTEAQNGRSHTLRLSLEYGQAGELVRRGGDGQDWRGGFGQSSGAGFPALRHLPIEAFTKQQQLLCFMMAFCMLGHAAQILRGKNFSEDHLERSPALLSAYAYGEGIAIAQARERNLARRFRTSARSCLRVRRPNANG
jgi:hypothetical protein